MRIKILAIGIYVYDWVMDCRPSWESAHREASDYYG